MCARAAEGMPAVAAAAAASQMDGECVLVLCVGSDVSVWVHVGYGLASNHNHHTPVVMCVLVHAPAQVAA